jgi:tRNA (adenine57-N1/adenine58-N1)-methyltransferase
VFLAPGGRSVPSGCLIVRAGPLVSGEPLLLIDRKQRRYLMTLKPGATADLRGGKLSHDELIGSEEGRLVATTRGERFLIVRPTLAEFVLEMPRGAQIIYPKDLSVILLAADIYPGATVLEAGTGSGALTMALLRAVGPSGMVYSYEVREDFARRATLNIERYLGPQDRLVMRAQDVYDGIVDHPLDRIVLDVPEPWRVVPHAAGALRSGGILLAYLPTVPQTVQLVEAIRHSGAFALVETTETLLRPWNIDGQSVRPAHRMVAHTAFITTARRTVGSI